ncbi:MAG: gliding motility-associated C-terminal domain-containing protein, partial [Cyclobacteriaceae bacterium]
GLGKVSMFKNITATGVINSGSFSAAVDFAAIFSGAISAGDLDGDGKPEIITVSPSSNTLSVIRNAVLEGPSPTIASFTPTSGQVGTSVTITGTNFDLIPANNIVKFNGTLATVTASTSTSITTSVPVAATSGTISVQVGCNMATSGTNFTVVTSCVPAVQRSALVALYNSTAGASWTNNTNWLNGDEAIWFGVTVTGCNITEIALDNNNLTGPIPAEIDDLPNLTNLSLAENNLFGAIPIGLGTLPSLIYLQLRSNQLTGTIPVELGNITTLQILNLADNQLTGTIPPELGNLSALQFLELWDNQLTGTIPSQLGNAASLRFLILGQNQLTGSIPISLGNIIGLFQLDLSENQLTGSIPPELGNNTLLTNLFLHVNQLTGPIPKELGNLVNLEILDIFTNQLSGTLPVELALCIQLKHLEVADNLLTGTLPIAYQSLVNLETFQINDNSFTGPVPVEYLSWTNIKELYMTNNQLDALPTFPPALITQLDVENNRLEFGDLESNMGITGYVYSPQAKLPPGGTQSVNENSPINIPFATSGTANSYQWFKDGSSVAGATSATFTKTSSIPADAGTYYVEVTSSIVTGLILQSEDYIISINAPPVILTTPITLPIQGETTLDLIPLITTGGSPLDISSLQVTVAPSSGALASIDANGILTLDYAGINFSGTETLSIRACDLAGSCTIQQFEIEVIGDIEVFNALSPNGDNINEKFIIRYIDIIPDTQNNHVTIYNRWGSKVFEVSDYNNTTNVFHGLNDNGGELPSGTYFYKIAFMSGRKSETGYLTLKK